MCHTILVVDDTQTVRLFEQKLLEEAGHRVLLATNGREGLYKAQQKRPDLVLLDIHMPHMNGVECCRRLKGSAETNRIKVIMVTSSDDMGQVRQAFDAGCDAYITKPIDREELLGKVTQLLRFARARAQLRTLIE